MPVTDVEFRVLGPVEVVVADQALPHVEPRQRAVLAALVVEAGRTVSTETLIDRVWGDDPPAQVRRSLQAHLSRVRRLLDGVGHQLMRGPGGYRLAVAPEQLDLHRFRALVARAEEASAPEERAALFEEARALWRGEPLAGQRGAWADGCRHRWAQEWIAATLSWAEAMIDAGDPEAVVGPLSQLVADQPLTESAAAALMRALAATGRSAHALAEFTRIRRHLRDELGIEPGPALQATQRDVLRGAVPKARASRPLARPAQLPRTVTAFVGRRSELTTLDQLRDDDPPVVLISGTAGVGKTALATVWCHQIKEDFPDGQLHVNLRGYDPDQPMTVDEALAMCLAGLLPPGSPTPAGGQERAARLRSELAGRRVLVLLDNAATVDQVRPLLPGDPGCLVVVTSRDSLVGVVARDGARRLDLDLFDSAAASSLLAELVGERAVAEPDATARLAELCAYLPLALRVAAERAVARPHTSLADLVAELTNEQRRLDLLSAGGDERTAVRGVLSWSVRELSPAAAWLFAMVARQPGPDLGVSAAAALQGAPPDDAVPVIDELIRSHLVRMTGPDRYDMHDLLRAYARGLPVADAQAAQDRLLDHYRATAARAMNEVYPAERLRRPVPPAAPGPAFGDARAALAWLDAERACLIAAGVLAAESGRPDHIRDLSATLFRYLDGRHHADALTLHRAALDAAREPSSEAYARTALAGAAIAAGRYDEATEHLEGALDLFAATRDLSGQGRVLANLGTIGERRADFAASSMRYERALDLFGQVPDDAARAHVLTRLGAVRRRLGRLADAAGHLADALELHRRTGHQFGEAWALSELGRTEVDAGRARHAVKLLDRAVQVFRELADMEGEASALSGLGDAQTAAGLPREAAGQYESAGRIFADIGDRHGQASALNGLGEAAAADGRPEAAVDHHEAALALAEQAGSRDQEARARRGLAATRRTAGNAGRAGRAETHERSGAEVLRSDRPPAGS
jgi:DNA-binding SARP family transcriptional activator/tetratricopeptide (TPR) repeat protein